MPVILGPIGARSRLTRPTSFYVGQTGLRVLGKVDLTGAGLARQVRRLVIRWEGAAPTFTWRSSTWLRPQLLQGLAQNQQMSRRLQMSAEATLRKAWSIFLSRDSVVRGAASPGCRPPATDNQEKGRSYLPSF